MSNLSKDVKFTAGQTIFSEGTPGETMYVIRSGSVEIRSGERVFDTLVAGEIFGEMALIDDSPRSADAVAVTDCELEEIGERAFLFRTSETPLFALKVMRAMAERLRAANQSAAGA